MSDDTMYVSNCPECGAFPVQHIAAEGGAGTTYKFVDRHAHMEPLFLDNREHATVLAALRCYQVQLILNGGWPSGDFDDIATNGSELTPLDDDDIDALCERINR